MNLFQFPYKKPTPEQQSIADAYYADETHCVETLIASLQFQREEKKQIETIAIDLVNTVRNEKNNNNVDALMAEYDLSSDEGIMLMCLAEALLRIPDKETEELLIRDKLAAADWEKHIGASESLFVNLTTRGLSASGKILGDQSRENIFKKMWYGLLSRLGEPVIRQAVRHAMKIMSEHFVLGRTIDEALKLAKPLADKGYLFSFDMLGEMAKTQPQADHYFQAYQHAISVMSNANKNTGDIFSSPSISIKLSALHPRYEFSQYESVVPFLIDRLKMLALQAKNAGITVTVDAEEAARLTMSLDIFEAVFADSEFAHWNGLGLAVQAYQKRAPHVLRYLIALARTYQKKIPVRLVKGAYWDTEIKIAQVNGFPNYPVFTRKVSTDISYLACAKLLLSAQNEIYPQFATHNAYTVAAILWMTNGKKVSFEFQNLQGMGKPLHNVLVDPAKYAVKSRIYAPVGQHADLLPYLVRRLLENGANTSFVHQIANTEIPISALTQNPMDELKTFSTIQNSKIPLPNNIYSDRKNSAGLDITDQNEFNAVTHALKSFEKKEWVATPMHTKINMDQALPIRNPNDSADIVGFVQMANETQMTHALQDTHAAQFSWDKIGIDARATLLEKAAELLEENRVELYALLIREAGKFLPDAVSEVREAADFCRYYAMIARKLLSPEKLSGPTGESNVLRTHGVGTVICVSPWNFPLAIFAGQIAASLVAGNCVIAKPAAQTPLIAARAVALFHEAGIPKSVLQLIPGAGSKVGNALIANELSSGVLFTGSTETAKTIQKTLANRAGAIVPLIAETGGINAMIADSSALIEQLVTDVMISAFGSAGQRCSALRVVFVQNDIADNFIAMLKGAMQTWRVGNTCELQTDVGPVIDATSQQIIQAHIDYLKQHATLIAAMPITSQMKPGTFISPTAFELPDFSLLTKEIFGPVLHVVRYAHEDRLQVVKKINALGYGLTFGIQTRIDETIDELQEHIRTGNIYVNRTMTGAVVGVQPFGGCGLSGTGPKAGGPHYLLRLVRESTLTINTTAMGGNTELLYS